MEGRKGERRSARTEGFVKRAFVICQKEAVESGFECNCLKSLFIPDDSPKFRRSGGGKGPDIGSANAGKAGGLRDGVGQPRGVKDVFSNRDRVNEVPLSKITPVIRRFATLAPRSGGA